MVTALDSSCNWATDVTLAMGAVMEGRIISHARAMAAGVALYCAEASSSCIEERKSAPVHKFMHTAATQTFRKVFVCAVFPGKEATGQREITDHTQPVLYTDMLVVLFI